MAKLYDLANQQLCYIEMHKILENKKKECSWEWLVNMVTGFDLHLKVLFLPLGLTNVPELNN